MLADADPSEVSSSIESAPEGSSIALCQLDSRWLDAGDREVQRLRSLIDRSIYRRLLLDTSHSITVSRLLAYDPPSDVEPDRHRGLVAEKNRWQAELTRQQALLGVSQFRGMESNTPGMRRIVSIRLFVFGRAGQVERLPSDSLEVAASERQLSESFREVWNLPRVFGAAPGFQSPPGLREPESLLLDLGRATSNVELEASERGGRSWII